MKRSTKYTLKYLTQKKKDLILQLFNLYSPYLQKTIDLLWDKKIPLRKRMSTKDITWMDDLGGQYKALIYQHASTIVRSCKFKKGRKHNPKVKNFTIILNQNQVSVESSSTSEFDKWIRIKLPFIREGCKSRRIEILIPIKEHKHSLKFKDWTLCNSIRLSKTYISFTFQKSTPEVKDSGKVIGIDQGYKKLLTTSEGEFIGSDFEYYYSKISRKLQGSKAFKRSLIERDNKINELLNQFDLRNIREIVIEDLKGIKLNSKGKFRKQFNNKLQRWVYAKSVRKLNFLCEENRVLLTKRNPAFTSQRCNICGFIHKNNRKGEKFLCLNCGNEVDADFNASINLSQLGVYSPQSTKVVSTKMMTINGVSKLVI